MPNAKSTGRFSETLTNIYVEQFCAEADRVYRLAFATTLSQKAAHQVVDTVFKDIANELAKLPKDADPDIMLLKRAWQKIHTHKASADSGDSELIAALKGMTPESRAALVAVDVLGLTSDEIKEIFKWEEASWRNYIAVAREKLMNSAFGKVIIEPMPVAGELDESEQ